MTQVLFEFHRPNGTPMAAAEFSVQLRKSSVSDKLNGVLVSDILTYVTKDDGSLLVELEHSIMPYYLIMEERGSDGDYGASLVRYKFFVPDSPSVIMAKDLFDVAQPDPGTWDEVTLKLIMEAKSASVASAASAKESATIAEASVDATREYSQSAATSKAGAEAAAVSAVAAQEQAANSLEAIEGLVETTSTSAELAATSAVTAQAAADEAKTYTLAAVFKASDAVADTTITLDLAGTTVLRRTLTAAVTDFVVTGAVKTDEARTFTVILDQGVGSRKVTWDPRIQWSFNREPTLSYDPATKDIVTVMAVGGMSTYFGFFNGGSFD